MSVKHAGPALVNPAFVATLRFSLLDLVRSRWLPLVVALLAIAAGAGIFAGQLGLIEQQRIALAFTAPLARLLAVALVALMVVAAITREADEGSRQLALSVALSRPAWVGARWLGFSLMAAVTALACAVPLALLAPVECPLGQAGWIDDPADASLGPDRDPR